MSDNCWTCDRPRATEIAIKILTLVLESLTAQTARDALAAAIYAIDRDYEDSTSVYYRTPWRALDAADAFMAERAKRHAKEAEAGRRAG